MSESGPRNASRRWRIALAGCGAIAHAQHLPVLREHPDFELVALLDPRRQDLGLPWFPGLAGLLDSGIALDALAIATPPQVREALALAAIRAGLAVLLEKPPAATPAAVERIAAAASAQGVTAFAAWHSRFAPMVGAARAWLDGQRLTGGRMSWREDVRKWHPGQDWIWREGGLGVFDPGINGLSLVASLHPAPLAVRGARVELPADADTPVAAQFELAGGDFCMPVELDFRAPDGETWRLDLDRGDGARAVLDQGGARWRDARGERAAPPAEYQGVYTHFAGLLAAGESELDARPLAWVAQAFAVAERVRLDQPFPRA